MFLLLLFNSAINPDFLVFCRAFAKSLAYSSATMGAVQTRDPAAIDELFSGLRALEFSRGEEFEREKLHHFEVCIEGCGIVYAV